ALVFFAFSSASAPAELYPLSLHDALPISQRVQRRARLLGGGRRGALQVRRVAFHEGKSMGDLTIRQEIAGRSVRPAPPAAAPSRSEEHTSELQSRFDLVCRLLLEKKKKQR